MKLEKNEYTTDTFIDYLNSKYGSKITEEPFNKNDVAQYVKRGMTPYRYGALKLSSKRQFGIRIIVIEDGSKR